MNGRKESALSRFFHTARSHLFFYNLIVETLIKDPLVLKLLMCMSLLSIGL